MHISREDLILILLGFWLTWRKQMARRVVEESILIEKMEEINKWIIKKRDYRK